MKSYNHLMEKVLSEDNVKLAIRKAAKGKRDRRRVQMILEDPDTYVDHYRHFALTYRHRNKPCKIIFDGIRQKIREIIVPSFDEQVLHHMIVNVLEPIIMHGMYEHVHGSIPKRGPIFGKRQIEKWMRRDRKNCKYCLKMDIKSFFGTISHDRLMDLIEKRIHDRMFVELLEEVIACTDIGLPLGFHTSHWLANWYLQGLDHYIKGDLRATYYMRYMDDMVVFGSNKKKLHAIRKAIERYLEERLGLKLKQNYQVFLMEYLTKKGLRGRDLDYMGFRFRFGYTIMRKSIMIRMVRKARRINRKEKPTIYDCKQMISALSWLKNTDTYRMYLKYIKPYVDFQYLKRRISRHDKKQEVGTWSGMK